MPSRLHSWCRGVFAFGDGPYCSAGSSHQTVASGRHHGSGAGIGASCELYRVRVEAVWPVDVDVDGYDAGTGGGQ